MLFRIYPCTYFFLYFFFEYYFKIFNKERIYILDNWFANFWLAFKSLINMFL